MKKAIFIFLIVLILIIVVFIVCKFWGDDSRTTLKTVGVEVSPRTGDLKFNYKEEYAPPSEPLNKKWPSPEVERVEQSTNDNVAHNKPVILLSRPIFFGKRKDKNDIVYTPWDRDGYFQHYSVDLGLYPSNLTDGDYSTQAYPASWYFDYVIDLEKQYELKKINIVWGNYGENSLYITSWKLYGQNQKEFTKGKELKTDNEWALIKSGQFPNTGITTITKSISARRFRIIAESVNHKKGKLGEWIGLHEFEAYQYN